MSTISDRKLAANRANALKSTGPRSESGKQTSSANAIKHGLFAQHIVLQGEDVDHFHTLKKGILLRLNPRDVLELSLADKIVSIHWKMHRLRLAEHEFFQQAYEKHCGEARYERAMEQQSQEKELRRGERSLSHAKAEDVNAIEQDIAELEHHIKKLKQAADPAPQVGKYLMHAMSRKDLSLPERYRKYEVQLENSLHRFMKEYRTLQSESVNEEPNEFANGVIDEIDAAPNLQNEATEAVQGAEERTADEPEVIDIETAKTNPTFANPPAASSDCEPVIDGQPLIQEASNRDLGASKALLNCHHRSDAT